MNRCPRPRVTRTRELECPECGLMWDPSDPTPDCQGEYAKSQKIAEREMAEIRRIMSKQR